jgi:hypothetical protein
MRSGNVLPRFNRLTHAAVNGLPVGATEHRARTKQGQRVVIRASIIHGDVPEHVVTDLLRQIDVDTEEVRWEKENVLIKLMW